MTLQDTLHRFVNIFIALQLFPPYIHNHASGFAVQLQLVCC